jgi:hypothetical protein
MTDQDEIKCQNIVSLFKSKYLPDFPNTIIMLNLKYVDGYTREHIRCAVNSINSSNPDTIFKCSMIPGILISDSPDTEFLVQLLPISRKLAEEFDNTRKVKNS